MLFIEITRINIKIGEKYLNVLDDYYMSVFPKDSYLFEQPVGKNYQWYFPRTNPNVSTALFFIEFAAAQLSRFVFWKKASPQIEHFLEALKKLHCSDIQGIKKTLISIDKSAGLLSFFYYLFLKFTKPHIIFVNCGFYGAKNAILIKTAKELGIKVAEIQHGTISKNHPSYNYAETLLNKGYDLYVPDYLLTFGEYWNTQMQNHAVKVAVGHPHLNALKKKYQSTFIPNSLLVLSQWTITDELINIITEFAGLRKDIVITYRLHPAEKLSDKQKNTLENAGVEISHADIDLYQAFAKTEFVLGCYTTALFEAYAFNKNIFILRNKHSEAHMPLEMGIWVDNGQEMAAKLDNEEGKTLDYRHFWADNFEENFTRFINNLDNGV